MHKDHFHEIDVCVGVGLFTYITAVTSLKLYVRHIMRVFNERFFLAILH
jgi:hypothetical protein